MDPPSPYPQNNRYYGGQARPVRRKPLFVYDTAVTRHTHKPCPLTFPPPCLLILPLSLPCIITILESRTLYQFSSHPRNIHIYTYQRNHQPEHLKDPDNHDPNPNPHQTHPHHGMRSIPRIRRPQQPPPPATPTPPLELLLRLGSRRRRVRALPLPRRTAEAPLAPGGQGRPCATGTRWRGARTESQGVDAI